MNMNCQNYQMNNGMMMNPMNNPMMNNQMNNGMMINQNQQMNNLMINNLMNNQMNNGMMMTPMNKQMNNPMMNNQMNNGMMINQNQQMNNLMMNNLINNQMNNGMMINQNQQMNNPMITNPINAQMNNPIIMAQRNVQMNYPMMMTPRNEQMNNSKNIQMNNGMIEPPMNSQIRIDRVIMMNKMDSQMNNPMMSNLMNAQMNNNMMKNQENLNNNIQNQINGRNNQIDNIIKNYPIENSSIVDNESTIKYYLYPKINFTDEEYNNSKVLLLVGQSGHGKTTFINALVNIYLGITIDDTFRYLLVLNENNDQSQSITKEITIYRIRPKKGLNFPPLILIDTPGFGDTKGEKEDKKHLELFRDFFESNLIKDVNCVLYVVNATNSRFGENDKKILDYLMNLFSKNLKENFVVGATHFTPENKNDIPNYIKTLSNENHFYYQRILKNEKLSREEIIKSYWYFASDNKIICNNQIERNLMEKEKWKNTEMQIKKFIENKLKILEKKDIKESENVLNNRFQLENEIKSFTEKIERLIPSKIVYEENLVKLQNYKSQIKSQKDEIQKNNSEKIDAYLMLNEINEAIPCLISIEYRQVDTNESNFLCEICKASCHRNCNCILVNVSKWFCRMINFKGNCKICRHSSKFHRKENIDYIPEEKKERIVNNEFEEISEYIKNLIEIEKIEKNNINKIENKNDTLNKILDTLNNEEKICNKNIKEYENNYLSVELDIIQAINKIKNNLNYLRKYALNKESRTIAMFVENYIGNKNEKKEKDAIEKLFKIYNDLIERNFNIDDLKVEQYKKINK